MAFLCARNTSPDIFHVPCNVGAWKGAIFRRAIDWMLLKPSHTIAVRNLTAILSMPLTDSRLVALTSIIPPLTLTAALYMRWRHSKTALAAGYKVALPREPETVQIHYRGMTFELRQRSKTEGAEQGAANMYLVLDLDFGQPTLIGRACASKDLETWSRSSGHSWINSDTFKLLVVGPRHAAIERRLSNPNLAAFLARVFRASHGTMTIVRETRVGHDQVPYPQWTMQLTGLPDTAHRHQHLLNPILDNVLRLRDLVIT